MQKIHFKAPNCWINDPNGFIWYKGQYHLFYQCFPYAPQWGRMHWGHAVSKDMVKWEEKGMEEDPENINHCKNDQFLSAQMMISSADGMTFDNVHDKKTIIPSIAEDKIGSKTHTRDPKVWRGTDAWYMVLGSSVAQKGRLLIYQSRDLQNWKYLSHVEKDNFGCLFSAFDEATGTMQLADDVQFLDYGLDLYAPQSTTDEDGNRIVIAWMRMPQAVDGKWNGMMCIPRVVSVKNDRIYFRPHPHIQNAFTKEISSPEQAGKSGYLVKTSLKNGACISIGGYRIWR